MLAEERLLFNIDQFEKIFAIRTAVCLQPGPVA
jgi:hypothetical protein